MKSFPLVATLVLALTGCGASSGGSGGEDKPEEEIEETKDTDNSSAQLVKTAADLPECDADHEGALVYVKDDKEFSACADSKWSVIDLKGEDGKDAEGSGAAGIEKKYACYGELGSSGIFATYRAAVMTSGDVFVFASVSDSGGEIGASNFYAADQVGAALGGITVGIDLSGGTTGGYWDLEMNRSSKVVNVTYHDIGDANDGNTYTINEADCVINE